jgi:hypothetical protein
VSCRTISNEELAKITPVNPPHVKRKIKPNTHQTGALINILLPNIVLNHLKTLTPVGIAIIIVAAVKYARVSKSIPTVNMW